jgi:hypothetical protein
MAVYATKYETLLAPGLGPGKPRQARRVNVEGHWVAEHREARLLLPWIQRTHS